MESHSRALWKLISQIRHRFSRTLSPARFSKHSPNLAKGDRTEEGRQLRQERNIYS